MVAPGSAAKWATRLAGLLVLGFLLVMLLLMQRQLRTLGRSRDPQQGAQPPARGSLPAPGSELVDPRWRDGEGGATLEAPPPPVPEPAPPTPGEPPRPDPEGR